MKSILACAAALAAFAVRPALAQSYPPEFYRADPVVMCGALNQAYVPMSVCLSASRQASPAPAAPSGGEDCSGQPTDRDFVFCMMNKLNGTHVPLPD